MADPASQPAAPVPPGRRRRRVVWLGVATVLAVGVVAALAVAVGAGGGDNRASGPGPGAAATGTASPSPTAPDDLAPPDPTRTPAPTAADLTGDDLPAAAALGPGWATQALADDAEEGVVGNGTPYQERRPAEVIRLLLPLGCAQRSTLPQPEAVLEASYQHKDGVPATALRLRMADDGAADRLVAVLADDLRACRDQPVDPQSGAGAPVADVGSVGDAVTSERVDPFADDPAERWSEVVLPAGDDVLVVAVNLAPDDPRYVGPDRLAAALRDLAA